MTNLAGAFMARPRTSIAEPAHDLPAITPHIEIVPTRSQKRARPKIAYAAVVVTGVLAIVVTQLLLSIGLSDGAYEISSLQSQQKELDRSNQVLSEQFDKLSSPQNLAASAESLGMVTNSAPVYLRLSDGAVLGSPVAAAGTSVTGGQALVPNSLLTPPTVAGATAAGAGAAGAESAPPAPEVQPDVPWQGALPSPTTR
ncbi:hypothetical protein [Herbiconiux ginsengi]|uniref:Cell division protein FtsL n=1 Tax=Herbiconiux ginsengi TaxID=381665 RepID=A0A1H3QBH7_9MICO|nr:hypothetical protein [Herbiconiux ginsengi]SDZ10766.1 hypothetical protein SAMN05216554_2431 [Herbiconiux ginsengi]